MAIDLTGASWFGGTKILFTGDETATYNINFTSNSVSYIAFIINATAGTISYSTSDGTITPVYSNNAWVNSSYKTISITGGNDVNSAILYNLLKGWGTLTLAKEFNKTKLTFTISYDLSSEEYAKLVNLVGANFVLVPILNNVDCHTYKDIDSEEAKTFYDLMESWGSSFNKTNISALSGEWNYGSGVAANTNTVSYTTSEYGKYMDDDLNTAVSSTIRFALYKATVVDNVATPTGDVVDTIGYSDPVIISCTFTEE